jgi:trimethylamine:corrinoid methyltransferase-like protein
LLTSTSETFVVLPTRTAPPMQDARVPRAQGLLALSTTMTSAVLAATALIMGGTGHPLSVPPDTPTFIND